MGKKCSKQIPARAAVLLLLFTVAGLSTLAKNNGYLPKSNPAHYLLMASRMRVVHLPNIFNRMPLEPVAKLVTAQPTFHLTRWDQPDTPLLQRIGLAISLQHRSPPLALA